MPRRYVTVIVVAAGVVVGGGLLVTVICRAREESARQECANNLKQWAFALEFYGNAHPQGGGAVLPPGTVPHPTLPPDQRLSWFVEMLPYIERDNVFMQLDVRRGAADPANERVTGNHFRQHTCPASGAHDRGANERRPGTPVTHYVGVAGVGPDAAELPLGHPRAGAFGHDRRTALADVTDGTSNTLLIIETANDPGHWAYGGAATVRAFDPASAPYLGAGRPFGGWHATGPLQLRKRAQHGLVATADGAVRAVASDVAPDVWEALATVSGKEDPSANW